MSILIAFNFLLALILGGDFFTGSVLSTALTKLVLRFNEKSKDEVASNTLRAEVCLLPFPFLFPVILTTLALDSQCL